MKKSIKRIVVAILMLVMLGIPMVLMMGASQSNCGGICDTNADCASNQNCVGSVCKTVCATHSDCPLGQGCLSGYCEAP